MQERPITLTRRVRVSAGLVVLLVAALALVGYERIRPNTDPDVAAISAAGVTVLLETEDYTGAVGGSGVFGTLAVLPGGCLGFDGNPRSLLLFPPGTTVRDDGGTVAVRVPGDGSGDPRFRARTLRPGDAIDGGTRGGGPVALSAYNARLETVTPKPCRGYPVLDISEIETG